MTQCGSPAWEFSDAVVVPRGRGVGFRVAAGCGAAAGADDPLGHHSGEVAAAATRAGAAVPGATPGGGGAAAAPPAAPAVAAPRKVRRLSPWPAPPLACLRSPLMQTRMPHPASGRDRRRPAGRKLPHLSLDDLVG